MLHLIYSKLIINISDKFILHRSVVFIVNFEFIKCNLHYMSLVFLFFNVEHVFASWIGNMNVIIQLHLLVTANIGFDQQ